MASAFVRAALGAACRNRAARRLAAPLGLGAAAAPSPPRTLATTAPRVVGGLGPLPRRAASSSSSSPAPVKIPAVALATNAAEEVQGAGNGGKSGQDVATEGAAVSACRFGDNINADLKEYIRGEMTKDAAANLRVLVALFQEERADRHQQGRFESNRQMVFALLLVLMQTWMNLFKKKAKSNDEDDDGGTITMKDAEEAKQEAGSGGDEGKRAGSNADEANGGKASGTEESKEGKAGVKEAKDGEKEEAKGGEKGEAKGGEKEVNGGSTTGTEAANTAGLGAGKAPGQSSATAAAVEGKGAA